MSSSSSAARDAELRRRRAAAALIVAALGVVFGDIGTSPLYAMAAVFSVDHHAVRPTEAGVYGVVSLVFWTLMLVVSVKYVTFIMRADNDGEGGIMALIALVLQARIGARRVRWAVVTLGILGPPCSTAMGRLPRPSRFCPRWRD